MFIKKRIKLTLVAVGFISLCLFFFSACSKTKEERRNESVKIGVTVPLTGSASVWGNYTLTGVQLAAEEINQNGGIHGKEIKLLIEDTKGNAKDGVNAFMKLVNSGVKLVVDDAVSSVALAIAPIANKNKIVVISTGATNPLLTKAGPYYFRVWNSDLEEGSYSAAYAYQELKLRNISILHVMDDYGKGLADVFEREFKNFGEATVDEVLTYELNETNFKDVLTKLKGKVDQAWYLVSKPKETITILKHVKEIGLEDKILIGSVAFQNEEFLSKIKSFYNGKIYYPYPIEPKGEEVNNFSKRYKEKFNKLPGTTSAEGYDALKILVKAIEIVGYDGEKVKDYLLNARDYYGPSGIIRFDQFGDVHKPMMMKIIN